MNVDVRDVKAEERKRKAYENGKRKRGRGEEGGDIGVGRTKARRERTAPDVRT